MRRSKRTARGSAGTRATGRARAMRWRWVVSPPSRRSWRRCTRSVRRSTAAATTKRAGFISTSRGRGTASPSCRCCAICCKATTPNIYEPRGPGAAQKRHPEERGGGAAEPRRVSDSLIVPRNLTGPSRLAALAPQDDDRRVPARRATDATMQILQSLKSLFGAPEAKASRASRIIALEGGGRARGTPRDYAALAREGYTKNAIVHRAVKLVAENVAAVNFLAYEGAVQR